MGGGEPEGARDGLDRLAHDLMTSAASQLRVTEPGLARPSPAAQVTEACAVLRQVGIFELEARTGEGATPQRGR